MREEEQTNGHEETGKKSHGFWVFGWWRWWRRMIDGVAVMEISRCQDGLVTRRRQLDTAGSWSSHHRFVQIHH